MKPALDRLLAAVALLLLAPLLVVVALCVLATTGRPVFFRQERVGLGSTTFRIVKFRTMLPDRRRSAGVVPQQERRTYHKSEADPRHTRLGRFLRRTSLDELPQLFNVVRGDMSLVGPRPELPHVVARYQAWQHQRHLVRPGLTGPWQVFARGDGPMDQHAQLDIEYVGALSLCTDLDLLTRTVPALLRRKGH